MRGIKIKKFFLLKAVIFFITVFFFFERASLATVASSKSYKLYTVVTDSGGGSVTSNNYTSRNSVGGPGGTDMALSSQYKLFSGAMALANIAPQVSILNYNDGSIVTELTPTLKWSYTDKDGSPQKYYQVQLSKDNFSTIIVDSGRVVSSNNSYTTPILSVEGGDISYRWRVRVSDGSDFSGWKTATNGFRLTTGQAEIPLIWAKTSSFGEDIPTKLWQGCASPYLYWEYPVTGVKIEGYSYAWGDLPDNTVDTMSTAYQTPDDLLSDGTRVFNLKAQNTAGNWSDVASFEIWIDRGAPTIGQYSPANGVVVATDKPVISISVTDDKSGVNPDTIDITINKSSVIASYDASSQSVVYLPSIPLSEGDNVVSLEVKDFVGNKTNTVVWSFMVDTKPPTGSIIINNEDAVTNSIYVALALLYSDSTTEVTSMMLSNDGVFDNEQWEPARARKENWALPAISGTRKVYVKFKDNAGNESQIFSDTIELIIIAPDTIITSGPSQMAKSKDALFTFKSTLIGSVFRSKFDDGDWSEWSNNTFVEMKGLKEGNHYFSVQAAKDVNSNTVIDTDEIDPVPAERTWTISEKGSVKPEIPQKKPFRFWKEE